MLPMGFEPAFPTSELPHVHASVSGATGIAFVSHIRITFHVITTSVRGQTNSLSQSVSVLHSGGPRQDTPPNYM
jgi:hypothetical protein